MRRTVGIAVVASAFALAGNLAGQQQDPGTAVQPRVIEMTAKKYNYTPGEIHVKKGTRVQLQIRATDKTHGFSINLYPEGADRSGAPGLRFDPPQDNWKLEKDQVRVIEFVADRPGTYHFKCTVFCGWGHAGMRGKLIVEE